MFLIAQPVSCAAGIVVRTFAIVLAATCLTGALPAAAQETFPNRPLRLIVSVGAGGATDVLTRTMGERLSRALGVNVLVENQPAGSGVVAAQTVARAAPDGHTLLIGTNTTHAGNASFLKNMPYDPINDFEPLSRMGIAALVLSVNSSVPATNVQEFIAYAKANPGKIGFGSGTGSARLASEMLKARAGIDILSVPYKGNAQALTDLRGGQIQMLFGDIALMLPHIRSGAVKGLAVSSARRSATMPEMPTMQEAGVAGYELVGFIAAFAPARTPEPVVRRLSEEINRILREKEVVDRLVALGVDAAPTTPAELRDWVVGETRKWRDLARGAGIQPE
ncbi:MAG: Bug family tripartite tricarboxylate transporter substrate binding protein [Burkholderiales bacterium]